MSDLWAGGDAPLESKYDGRWTRYTPAWTSTGTTPTLGNGSINGTWLRVGDSIFLGLALIMGSTTTFGTGGYFFSVPVSIQGVMGSGGFFALDSSAGAYYWGSAGVQSSTTLGAQADNTGGLVGQTLPFTWASGDQLVISGWLALA